MERKIGITGAAGFVGRHLAAALRSKGYKPVLFEGDVCNADEVDRFVSSCYAIFHLACKHCTIDNEIIRVTIEGGKNLASAAKRHGNRRLIFMSSNYILRYPDSGYSTSKLSVENMFSEIAGVNGCSVINFRFPNIYGPGCRPFYNSAIATFCWYEANGLGDQMPIFGDGNQKTDYIAVDKVVEILLSSLSLKDFFKKIDVKGDIFSVNDLVDIIRDPKKRIKNPAIQAEVDFFAKPKPLPQKILRTYPVHRAASGSFQELIREDEMKIAQLSMCTIEVANQRGGHYHTHKEEWFCVVQGKMALDFYTIDCEYLQTQLLTAEFPKFVHIPPNYLHVARNMGNEIVKFLIVCNEEFRSEDADTYKGKIYI